VPSGPKQSKYELPGRLEAMMATVSEYLAVKKEGLLQRILVNSRYSVHEEWSYDNWNGGTAGHAVTFQVPRSLFSEIVGQIDELSDRLCRVFNEVNAIQNEFVEKVFFEVDPGQSRDWRLSSGAVLPRDSGGAVLVALDGLGPWSADHLRLFVSHVSTTKVAANNLKKELAWYGVSAFVAHEDIEPTAIWQREIERALASMHCMLAVATPGFRSSHWCQQEVGWALGRGVPIIGLRAGEDPPGFIAASQALSADPTRHAETAKGVVKLLVKDGRTASLTRETLVARIEETASWEWLRELIDCLVGVGEVTPDQLDRLKRASVENEHLRTNRSLPTLNAFINKHERATP
jgi:hypothetical protein